MVPLIMGGSGLFGRKTIYYLLQDPEITSVVSMDLVPPSEWFMKSIEKQAERFHFVRGTVAELEDILNAISLYRVDRVVNWAFLMGAAVNTNPRLSTKVNALGMCNAFEAAKLMGIKRVIYASSETVYGPQSKYGEREVTEDDQLYPSHSYAVCKYFAEIIAGQYSEQYGMNFTGLRPTIGYGHGGRSPAQFWSDLPSFTAVGKPYSFPWKVEEPNSLVSADDLGIFTRILLKAESSPHSVYNVGGPPTTIQQAAEAVLKYIPDAKIEYSDKPSPFAGKEAGLPWLVSSERAKKDFGFTCLPLEEAILIHINDARMEAGLAPISGKP